MAIYKRTGKKKTSWYLCYYDDQGKQVWKSFDKKRDAEAYEGKVKVAKKENRYPEVFDIKQETVTTFNQLADHYVATYKDQKCYQHFKSHVIRELRAEFGEKKLSQITYMDLELWRKRRKDSPTRQGKPRTDGSVNCDVAILAHMFSKAETWGLLEKSPLKKGARLMYKVDNQRTRYLEEPQIEALLAACPPHLKPIVETALLSGMRRGEILSLRWEQIRNGFIYLEGAMTKSGKGRQIPVNDKLQKVFNGLRQKALQELRQRQTHEIKSQYVFCDSQGRRFKEVRGSFRSACRRAGIEDFRFHDLRHTFASQLIMNGASIKAVQELLGHASLAMTMRYSHLSKGHLRDAVNLLNTLGIGKTLEPPRKNESLMKVTSCNY